jgi:hypothetical protein
MGDMHWLDHAGNLAGAIALQTAMAATGHSGLARCDDCGDLYRSHPRLAVEQPALLS